VSSRAALFSDHSSFENYVDMVLRNAEMLAGIDLDVKGDDSPEEKTDSLLASLIDHGLAEIIEDYASVRIPDPLVVWQGSDTVRLSAFPQEQLPVLPDTASEPQAGR